MLYFTNWNVERKLLLQKFYIAILLELNLLLNNDSITPVHSAVLMIAQNYVHQSILILILKNNGFTIFQLLILSKILSQKEIGDSSHGMMIIRRQSI
jgi:hypothetical protein